MKLRNKIAAITAAAMLAFTGVGFAAWTFTNVENAEIGSITDKVAVGIELKEDSFAVYHDDGDSNLNNDAALTGLYSICDAPTQANLTAESLEGVLAGNGAYWAINTGTELAPVYTQIDDIYLKGTLTKDMEDGVEDKTSVTVSFTGVKTNFGAQSYLSFGDMTISNKTVSSITAAGDYEVISDNFDLPAVSYVSIPTSISELTAMNTALGTALASAKLTFTAQISA